MISSHNLIKSLLSMKLVLITILLSTFTTVICENELIAAVILVNRGSSSPHVSIPTGDWNDWVEKGPHELTTAGMREQYLLGRELREVYINDTELINATWLYNELEVIATNHNNTIASAQAFLTGFLGKNPEELLSTEQPFAIPPMNISKNFSNMLYNVTLPYGIQTFPIHVHSNNSDDIFDTESCPVANKALKDNFATSKDVRDIRLTNDNEIKVQKILGEAYNLNVDEIKFPNYYTFVESVVEMMYQYRDTYLNINESNFVYEYAKKLYFLKKTDVTTARQYRSYPILKHIVKTFDLAKENRKQNDIVKLSMIFTDDEMMSCLLHEISRYNLKEIRPSSIVTLSLYAVIKKPYEVQYNVTLKFNDERIDIAPVNKIVKYENFVKYVESLGVSVEPLSKHCKIVNDK